MYKTTFYQRQRGQNQQAPTNKPCLNCGAKPAESCHVINWLRMRRYGFPPSVINQEWNLMPLCRSCHWLYDDRADIWIGHHIKQKGIANKKGEVLTEFMSYLGSIGINARLLSENDLEEVEAPCPHFGGIEAIDIWYGTETYLVTKIGTLKLDEYLEEEEQVEIEQIWETCLKKFNVLTGKEYRHRKKEMETVYQRQREMLLKLIASRCDEAMKQADVLARQYLVSVTLQNGKPWVQHFHNGAEIYGEISAFDITNIKNGIVIVKIWQEKTVEDGNIS